MNSQTMKLNILLALLVIFFNTACGTVPIYAVYNAQYVSVNGNVTLEQAKNAIVNAGASSRWLVEEIKPGYLIAKRFNGSQNVEVDIKYTTKVFSISYKDSHGLDYDGLTIDVNYNRWVQNLHHSINKEFDSL